MIYCVCACVRACVCLWMCVFDPTISHWCEEILNILHLCFSKSPPIPTIPLSPPFSHKGILAPAQNHKLCRGQGSGPHQRKDAPSQGHAGFRRQSQLPQQGPVLRDQRHGREGQHQQQQHPVNRTDILLLRVAGCGVGDGGHATPPYCSMLQHSHRRHRGCPHGLRDNGGSEKQGDLSVQGATSPTCVGTMQHFRVFEYAFKTFFFSKIW